MVWAQERVGTGESGDRRGVRTERDENKGAEEEWGQERSGDR